LKNLKSLLNNIRMAKNVLIKPIISEKSDALSENSGKYSFIVNKKANKIEIRAAVQDLYGVTVSAVNTMVVPGKRKSRNTKAGVIKGMVSPYKKAIVTLEEGESIDLFGDI